VEDQWHLTRGDQLEAINIPEHRPLISAETLPTVDLEQPVRLPAHSITVVSSGRGR